MEGRDSPVLMRGPVGWLVQGWDSLLFFFFFLFFPPFFYLHEVEECRVGQGRVGWIL